MVSPGSETSTLNKAVPHTAVLSPTRTRLTENVDNRLISGGRPIMRCTAINRARRQQKSRRSGSAAT